MHATSTVVTLIIHNCHRTTMAALSSCVLQTGSFYLKEPATLFIKNTHRWNIMFLIRVQFEMTCMGGDYYSNFSTKHSCSRVKTAITLIKEKWFRASGDSQKTAHLNFFQYNIYTYCTIQQNIVAKVVVISLSFELVEMLFIIIL